MTIIEIEIAKRQEIIDGKAEKIARAEDLRKELEALEVEVAGIDTENLVAEIEELKTYLPHEDEPEAEEATEEVVD